MGTVHIVILALALISIVLSGVAIARDRPLDWNFAVPELPVPSGTPLFERVFDYTANEGQAHSPAILAEEGGFSVVWFEGSAEAQADVDIHRVVLRCDGDGWRATVPAPFVTRAALGRALDPQQLVVTLGNSIQNEAQPDALFGTAVSVGGWAMASVADIWLDGGQVASARKLNLSPLLNRSHLVKSPMVAYADGSHALPAYFEMGPTYAELVRFAPDGRVRDVRRMPSSGVKAIQPMVVVHDAQRAVAFIRDFDPSGRLWISRTNNGGQSWSEVEMTETPNPSAPVAALPLAGGSILMAMNDDAADAGVLRLAVSRDQGNSWRVIHTFEHDGGALRYPMLRRLAGGEIALAYSHATKRGIRAYVLNDAWVAAQ